MPELILLTDLYTESQKARAIPGAIFQDRAYWLSADPDPSDARRALKLFPGLHATHPQLADIARQASLDTRPIDFATPFWDALDHQAQSAWRGRWLRTGSAAYQAGITAHEFQCKDVAYAIHQAAKLGGAYLGHEVGLGKSLMALMFADGNKDNFAIIVAPNAAKQDPWGEAIPRFAPWLTPIIMGNNAAARSRAVEQAECLQRLGEPFAFVCHYEALALLEKHPRWKHISWDLRIFDEAHRLKNPKAQFVRAARRLKAVTTLMLSGSVMDGEVEHLVVPLQMMSPKRYRSKWAFLERYVDWVDTDYGRIVLGPKEHRLEELRAELGEYITVRLAADELDIPEPHVSNHVVPLLPAQKKAYRQVCAELLAELEDGTMLATTDGAPLLTACRRITGGVPDADGVLQSSKLDRALELLKEAAPSQAVVFAWHRAVVDELHMRLQVAGIPAGLVHGGVTKPQRDAAVRAFKAGETRVLVATIATLSASVNLQNASIVLFCEESFSATDMAQAVGRVVRQGQTANASVHYLRAADTVDMTSVWPTHVSKAQLNALLLGRPVSATLPGA